MHCSLLWTYWLSVLAQLFVAVGKLTVVPNNTATSIGGSAEFRCKTDSNGNVRWLLNDLQVKDNITYTVFDGTNITAEFPHFRSRFEVNTTLPGQFDLILTQVANIDAGTFTCVESISEQNASAIHTVITSGPICSTLPNPLPPDININDTLVTQCNVSYNGSRWQRPQVTWFASGRIVSNDSQIVGDKDLLVSSSLTLIARPPTVDHSSRIHFSELCASNDQPTNLARTIPIYAVYPWNTSVIFVHFPATDITIDVNSWTEGDTDYVNVLDSLTCHASGYPHPTYRWRVAYNRTFYQLNNVSMTTNSSATAASAAELDYQLVEQVEQVQFELNGSTVCVTQTGNWTLTCIASNVFRGEIVSVVRTMHIAVINKSSTRPSTATTTLTSHATTSSTAATTTLPSNSTTSLTVSKPFNIVGPVAGGVSAAVAVVIVIALFVFCFRRGGIDKLDDPVRKPANEDHHNEDHYDKIKTENPKGENVGDIYECVDDVSAHNHGAAAINDTLYLEPVQSNEYIEPAQLPISGAGGAGEVSPDQLSYKKLPSPDDDHTAAGSTYEHPVKLHVGDEDDSTYEPLRRTSPSPLSPAAVPVSTPAPKPPPPPPRPPL